MPDLKVLCDALATGLRRGALIHEKTGTVLPVEVLAAEAPRVLGIVRVHDGAHELFRSEARVRVELPREGSVIFVPGRLREFRANGTTAEVELDCERAEDRQRRMEVRIDASCRIRLQGGTGDLEETRTVNLSAGGALVVCDSRARPGELVDVELELDGRMLRCRAEVVRRGVKTNGAPSRTSAALKFVGLDEATREQIAMYVLGQQACEKAGRGR